MIPLLIRIVKRVVVLGFGAVVIYLTVWQVYPFFDNRVPIALALFATYVAMAYFVIPSLFRVFRFFYRPTHIPVYSVTPDGFASDPVNIALLGDRATVVAAMQAAGWHLADDHTLATIGRQILSALLRRSYPEAPMSHLYLFGRQQDLGFEIQIGKSGSRRHHVRFWGTDAETAEAFEHQIQFWRRFYRPKRSFPKNQLWVGAASKDVGFAPIRHNAQLTHMIDSNTDRERDLIVNDLRAAKRLKSSKTIRIHRPYSLKNRAWRGFLKSDGRLTICKLR